MRGLPVRKLRLAAFVLLAVLRMLLDGAAFAQTLGTAYPLDMCAGDRFGGNLNCTANDVQITNIKVSQSGNQPTACVGGSSITMDLDVTVNFGSATRYDVGIFLAQDGGNPQLQSTRTLAGGTGSSSCKVAILPSPSLPGGTLGPLTPFPNLDPGPYTINGQTVYDTCGDGSSSSLYGGAATATFTVKGVTVQCRAIDSSGKLNIPFVVSWDQNSSPTGAVCTSAANPVPGSPSKCSAPVGGVQGNVSVVTLPAISKTNGVTSVTPGDALTYTVTVSNTTGVTLTNTVFKDSAVSNLSVSSVTCAAQNASCPAAADTTVAAMQGTGITMPQMLAGGTMTFTINASLTGNPTGTLTNVASVSVGSASNTASDTDTIKYPALVNAKTVTVLNDPVNGTTNPKSIPGSESLYSITVSNTGPGRVDDGSVVISDSIPANTSLFVGNLGGAPPGPVTFSSSGSNLTFTYTSLSSLTDDLDFSRDRGVTWNYVPVPDANGFDAAVTDIRLKPKGRMEGWSGSGAYPSFTFTFKVNLR